MNKKVLFFAPYPNKDNIKDGMIQRIFSIDKQIEKSLRTYMQVSLKSNFKLKKSIYNNLVYYELNLFIHLPIILYIIFKHKNIYFHSLHNFFLLAPIFLFIDKNTKNMILDIHGAVPEELEFMGKNFKSKYFELTESILFKKLNYAICVNESMKNYYQNKYKAKVQYIVQPILPQSINYNFELSSENANEINFIYSGNTQKWQNIDKILQIIQRISSCKNYTFTILTGDKVKFEKMIQQYNINMNKILIKSVQPHELKTYYINASYGFLIRDEHVLNKVANPTKLMEYMSYGIIPIVDYYDIGDMLTYKYDYIHYENLECDMNKSKSYRNIDIVKSISQNYSFSLISILK